MSITIPSTFPVRPLKKRQAARDRMTCGTCGLSWDDAIPTSYTPTPSARCPFEAFHEASEPDEDGARKWQPGDTPTCNEHLVRDLMNYNPTGALCQAMVIQALQTFTKAVIAAGPEKCDSEGVSGAAWVRCAQHMHDTMNAFYSRRG